MTTIFNNKLLFSKPFWSLKSIRLFYFFLVFSSGISCVSKNNKALNIHDEITIGEIRQDLSKGKYTIAELTQFYLDRIDSLSINGPQLNALINLNPKAIEIANQLDEEWKNGQVRGPLHGIPILLKDNVDTDDMSCTAGSIALKDSYPLQDSPLAAQLRKAGAIILGKANMSEWANFHSNISSSGWSALGGQTKNPYDLSRNPCGSSSGSAVAVAANLSVLAIGTETNGSIVCPSNNNGIVGIKPTVGLISRSGIIPISFTQDTGGPMARTVRDAALCLGALTDIDSLDSKTLQKGRVAYTDYTQFLKKVDLNGKRIGFYKSPLTNHVRLRNKMEDALSFFEQDGAEIIKIDGLTDGELEWKSFQVLLYEFKDGLNKYFASLGPNAKIGNLDELIEKTFADGVEMRYHDHELLKLAQAKEDLTHEDYQMALKAIQEYSQKKGIDYVMNKHKLDVIIAPTGGPAWKTDWTNGDNYDVNSSSPAAIAGYPNITVPMGQIDGLPVGISFFGSAWSEATLLEFAYTYEQGTKHRESPKYLEGTF